MKNTSIAILALIGAIDARHHHHRVSLAQGITNGAGGSNPDSNRKQFNADVATAAAVVAKEHSSENTRTTTHADAMASQYKQTFDKNAATRTKYVNTDVANNVVHDQWVVRTDPSTLNTAIWAQTSEPKKEKAANPDSNRSIFDADVKNAAAVVAEEHKSENTRTTTHAAAMASQYKQTFDKNAATRTKYVNNNVANNVVHDQWVVRTDPTTLNTGIWAQTSQPGDQSINSTGMDEEVHAFIIDKSPDETSSRFAQISEPKKEKAATPDSNRAIFDADVKNAAAVVAAEHSSENTRTTTHAAAMASQYKQTFDKNAATRTKYVNTDVANNVVHNQWVVRSDPSTLNTAIWAQTSAPGDRTINAQGMDPRVASLLTGGDPDSNEIINEFVQYDNQNKLWRMI